MAQMTVDCGSFNKTSYGGATQYGSLINFYIPDGATVTGCSVSFTTHGSGGQTVDRAFSLNGSRAHSGWPSTGMSLSAGLLRGGNNTFRVTLRGNSSSYASWNISGITLYITYNESGGGSSPPVGGGGPVVISPSSIDAGAGSVTVTCPAEAGIWHMINWSFGSQSGEWAHSWELGGTRTISIPLSWISEIPNATSGILAIRVRRSNTPAMPYSYVTDQTTNVTIKVPASVVPSISNFTATLVPNGVPSAIAGYVQNKSKVSLAISAAPGAYSSISSYNISGGGINSGVSSGTFGPFNLSGDVVFTAKVTDSRGRTATRQVAINIMPYTAPAFSLPEAWRSNYDGVKNQKGTYVRLKSGANFSSLGEQNAVSLKGRVYIKGGVAPAWESMTPDTELILGGGTLLSTRTYIAQIQVSDLLESRITEFIIPTKKTGLAIMAGVSGAAIGKSAETPGILDVAWPIVAPGLAPNPNLLHNWDFRNPVNQREVSGEISTGTYFYDRWIRNSGTVTTNADYLTIDASAEIEQRIEGNLLAGETVTVSVMVGGTVFSGTGIMPTSGTESVTLTGWGTATLGYATEYMYVRLAPTAASNVQAVKLELGTGSTLHLDPPMDHAIETNKCRRFYIKTGAVYLPAISTSTTLIRACLTLPVAMRVHPTLISVGSGQAFKPGAAMTTVTDISVYQSHPTSLLLQGTTTGLTAWQMYQLAIASIELSSDL